MINSVNLCRFIPGPKRKACGISHVQNSSTLARLQESSNMTLHFLCCISRTCKSIHNRQFLTKSSEIYIHISNNHLCNTSVGQQLCGDPHWCSFNRDKGQKGLCMDQVGDKNYPHQARFNVVFKATIQWRV